MYAGFLDVFHDAADDTPLTVSDGVHVNLYRIFEELVYEYGVISGGLHCPRHVFGQAFVVVDHLHGPATEHVRRTHHYRIADSIGGVDRFVYSGNSIVVGLPTAQFVQQSLEALAVLGLVYAVRAGAQDWHTVFGQFTCQI